MKFNRYNKKKRNITKYFVSLFVIISILFVIFLCFHYFKKDYLKNNIFVFFDFLAVNYDYKLKNIEINSLRYIEKDKIINFFENQYNNSIFLIPVEKILKQIKKEKWIKKVKIKSNYKDTLSITIVEHIPEGIFIKNGKSYAFDNEGNIIDNINLKNTIFNDLIIFEGEKALNYSNLFLNSIPLFLAKEIKEAIYINQRRWDVLLKNGIKLKLKENEEQKSFMYYEKIYKNMSNNDLEEIKSIDLRINNKAIIKFKNN